MSYSGWTNYETWAVKLWMDNGQSSYEYWLGATRECWQRAEDKSPNQFMGRSGNARQLLADQLKDEHDSQSEHPVFKAAEGTVYADLLNASLGRVNWHEIAGAMLEDMADEGDERYSAKT